MKRKWGGLVWGAATLTAAFMLALTPCSPAFSATTSSENFIIQGVVNTPLDDTRNVDQVICEAPAITTSVRVRVTDLEMNTDLNVTNTGSGLAIYTIERARHIDLGFSVPAASISILPDDLLPNETGQQLCVPDPCGGPSPAGNYIWSIPQNGNVNVPDILVTDGRVGPYLDETYFPGDLEFGVFAGTGTFSATLRSQASVLTDTAGTFEGGNVTNAMANISLQATCGTPGLRCNGKAFDIATITDPNGDGVATATVSFTNTGSLDLTQVVITDELDATYMAYIPGSTTVNGSPGPDPSGTTTLVWSNVPIDAGQTLTVTYGVEITGVPPDTTVCNNAYAETTEFGGLTTVNDDCSDCITTPPPPPPPVVPAFNPFGLLLFAGLIPLTWVLIGRRKK